MNQINLVAVPNGMFTFEEALESHQIQEAFKMLKNMSAPTKAKIKTFLAIYQMIDILAQLENQGFDIKQVNMDSLSANMKYTIDEGYDEIMKTFTNHQRKQLHELVN
ncbi:hypothetical protein [Burkholderia orbicola]|uniref:hypothetical protein n=1 Tax=Burkholderia orbicola TaxID=2978683 RepID=UPI001903780B|nr:hypothetical protein [Burkholderia orbicola]MBK1820507.1 hypothetical protein [Burkholderia orbicola]